jgi:hypothetical protein
MAKQRPFRTFYSDGTVGCASTAHRASLRAFRKVIEGGCKQAEVVNQDSKSVMTVWRNARQVMVHISRPKDLK